MDERVRELERRWRGGGDPEDEQAWLEARLREGELSPARLRLAAFLGHAGARELLAPRDWGEAGDPRAWALVPWVQHLTREFGHEATVAAAVAAGRSTLRARPDLAVFAHVVEAAARWLESPGPDTARAASRAGDLAGLGLDPDDALALEDYWAVSERPDVREEDLADFERPGRHAGNPWPGIGWDAGLPWGRGRCHADEVIPDLTSLHGDELALRADLARDLLAWALR